MRVLAFWAVIQSQPMCERRVMMHLDRQGFAYYTPREKIVRIKRGRKITASRYLFPRYLFVWIESQWQRLFYTFGVSRVLMSGDKPSKLPDGWIDRLKASEKDGLIVLPKRSSDFIPGQQVQVTGGLFAGAKGLYQGMTSRQREVILLDHLGCVELASGLLK
jgi:transcription antitermination factor NusG